MKARLFPFSYKFWILYQAERIIFSRKYAAEIISYKGLEKKN